MYKMEKQAKHIDENYRVSEDAFVANINNRRLFFLISLTILGFGIFSVTDTAVEYGKTGAWAVILLSCLYALPGLTVCVYLSRKNGGISYVDALYGIYWKPLAKIFTAAYLIYYMYLFCVFTGSVSFAIFRLLLPKTDTLVIAAFLILAAALAAGGLKSSLGAVFELLGVLVFALFFILFFAMLFFGNILNTLPLFEVQCLPDYVAGTYNGNAFYFLAASVICVIPLADTMGKKAFGTVVFAALSSSVLMVFLTMASVMISGVNVASIYKDDLFYSLRQIDIPFLNFVEQFDILFMIAWLFCIFCVLQILFYSAVYCARLLCPGLKGNIAPSALILAAICAFVFVIVNFNISEPLLSDIAFYFGMITFFVLPLVSTVVHLIKRNGHNEG